jgi:hypothetical protein
MPPTDADIAALDDPVLRNLWITQRYHELALGLADRFGEDVTWCAFATWASKSVGATIRNEELPDAIRARLGETAPALADVNGRAAAHGVEAALARHHLDQVVDRVCADVSHQLAEGNRLVFAELAPVFAALLDAGDADVESSVSARVADLRATGIETAPIEEAFAAYGRALNAAGAERCRWMLEANVLAVAHEQERLQPAVTAALDAGVRDTFVRVVDDHFSAHLPGEARQVLTRIAGGIADLLDDACQRVLTEAMLRLVTADERLDLSTDIPALPAGLWPPELADLERGELVAFTRWDRTGGIGRPTGAKDWSLLEERMNYIVNLFRSRQHHPGLLDHPFDERQVADLRAGRRPAEPL